MALVLQPYELPPITTNDVTLPETLRDALHALETLSVTVDDIFGRLETKIAAERTRLSSITGRIAACQVKVEALRGSKNATTVFSTAKFPASKTLPLHATLYDDETIPNMPNPHRALDDDVQYQCADPKKSSIANEELTGELYTLLSRLNSCGTDIERVEFIMEDKGLGSLPPLIPSVGSLLLFNSTVNPYMSYQTMDNLFSTGRTKARDAEEGPGTKVQLASAPTSLLSRDALADLSGLDLTFKPSLGEVSALALPANLPLDFVATDIQYSGLALPSIAPSSFSSAAGGNPQSAPPATLAAGPSASQPPPPPPPSSLPAVPASLPQVEPLQTTHAAAASLPPPPPPPPPKPPAAVQAATASAVAPVAMAAAAEAAPAASAGAGTAAPYQSGSDEAADAGVGGGGGGMPAASSAQDGGRSSLLDAIKGMSIDKLRKREEDNVAAAKQQREDSGAPAPAGGGKGGKPAPVSMMDEMKERMRRRNSALTGKLDKEKQKRDSEIVQAQRDSMMVGNTNSSIYAASGIPPPPNMRATPAAVGGDGGVPIPPPPPPAPAQAPALSATSIAKALNRNANKKRFDDSDSSDGSDDSSSVVTDITTVTAYDSGGGRGLGAFNRGPPAALPPPIKLNSANPSLAALLDSRAKQQQQQGQGQAAGPPLSSPPAAPMATSAPAASPSPLADAGSPVASGGGGGGGGLLDASRGSAISQMLQAAKKKKQKGSDDDSDDEWD